MQRAGSPVLVGGVAELLEDAGGGALERGFVVGGEVVHPVATDAFAVEGGGVFLSGLAACPIREGVLAGDARDFLRGQGDAVMSEDGGEFAGGVLEHGLVFQGKAEARIVAGKPGGGPESELGEHGFDEVVEAGVRVERRDDGVARVVGGVADVEAPGDGDVAEVAEEDDVGSGGGVDDAEVFVGGAGVSLGDGVAGGRAGEPRGLEVVFFELDVVGHPAEEAGDFEEHLLEPGGA